MQWLLFPGTVPQRFQPESCLLLTEYALQCVKIHLHGRLPLRLPRNRPFHLPPGRSHIPDPVFLFLIQLPAQNDRVRSVHRSASIRFPHSSKFIPFFSFILLFTASYYFLQLNFFYHFAIQGINGKYSIFQDRICIWISTFRNRNRAWI